MILVRTLSGADQDFLDAIEYYNRERFGLGHKFANEIQMAFDYISAFPAASPSFSQRSRRHVLRRFPYGIWYEIRPDHLLILAIMDLRREPSIWQDRLKQTR